MGDSSAFPNIGLDPDCTLCALALLAANQVTGGRDGCVRLWDPRVSEPVVRVEPRDGEVKITGSPFPRFS